MLRPIGDRLRSTPNALGAPHVTTGRGDARSPTRRAPVAFAGAGSMIHTWGRPLVIQVWARKPRWILRRLGSRHGDPAIAIGPRFATAPVLVAR